MVNFVPEHLAPWRTARTARWRPSRGHRRCPVTTPENKLKYQ